MQYIYILYSIHSYNLVHELWQLFGGFLKRKTSEHRSQLAETWTYARVEFIET